MAPESSNPEFQRRWQLRKTFMISLSVEERDQRSLGYFFNTLESVWSVRNVLLLENDWFAPIVRSIEQGTRLYETKAAVSDENIPLPMSPSSDWSSATNTDQTTTAFDMFNNPISQRAHLISDSKECHKAYGFISQAATGKRVPNAVDRLNILIGVKRPGATRRTGGLKHHRFNKMYLASEGDYFDSHPPKMVIVPLLSLECILDWNGTDEYDIMAITCGEYAEHCSEQVLRAAPSTCSEQEIEMARVLLEAFVKAIACSVRNDPVRESFTDDQVARLPPMNSLKRWSLLKTHLEGKMATIGVPQQRTSGVDWDDVRVAKAKVSRANSLPDPYLLVMKAAISYSAHNGEKLMP